MHLFALDPRDAPRLREAPEAQQAAPTIAKGAAVEGLERMFAIHGQHPASTGHGASAGRAPVWTTPGPSLLHGSPDPKGPGSPVKREPAEPPPNQRRRKVPPPQGQHERHLQLQQEQQSRPSGARPPSFRRKKSLAARGDSLLLTRASALGLAMYVFFCVSFLAKVHLGSPTSWRSIWGGARWGPVHLTVPASDSTRWKEAMQAASSRYLVAGTVPLSRMEGFAYNSLLQLGERLGCDASLPGAAVVVDGNRSSTTTAYMPTRSPLCFCVHTEFRDHLSRALGYVADGLNRSSMSSSLKDPYMRLAIELANADKAAAYAQGIGACILRHSAGSRSTRLLGQWCASAQEGGADRFFPFYVTLDPYSLVAGALLAPALLCSLPWAFLFLRAQGLLPSGKGAAALLELGSRLALLLLFVACSVPVDLAGRRASRTEGLGGWVVLVASTVLFALALGWGAVSGAARLWAWLFWSVPEALRSRLPPAEAHRASPPKGTLFQQSLFVQVPLLCVLAEIVSHRRDALLDVGSSFGVGVLGAVLGAALQECGALYDVFRGQRLWMRRRPTPPQQQKQGLGVAPGGEGEIWRGHREASLWRLEGPHSTGRPSASSGNAAVLRIVRGFHARSSDMAWSAFVGTLGVLQGLVLWRAGFLLGPSFSPTQASATAEAQLVAVAQLGVLCLPFLDALHLLAPAAAERAGTGLVNFLRSRGAQLLLLEGKVLAEKAAHVGLFALSVYLCWSSI